MAPRARGVKGMRTTAPSAPRAAVSPGITSNKCFMLLPARSSSSVSILMTHVATGHGADGVNVHRRSRSLVTLRPVTAVSTPPTLRVTVSMRASNAWSSGSGRSTVTGSSVPAVGATTRQSAARGSERSIGPTRNRFV